ncbi:MAG TPA: hypothetical protein GX707_17765 [Epulopiscium sp.]|nr:hypothetical protein [Candidatus Epulonipiscium sp.]
MRIFLSKLTLIVICILCSTILIFAEGQDRWQYSKKVTYGNEEELKAIYLDEDIYRYANQDLSDIRLVNEKGEFTPYYIYNGFTSTNREEQMLYTSEEVISYTKENDHYTDFKMNILEKNKDIIGNTLIFEMPKDNFYKEIKILGSYNNRDWENIKTDIIYRINGQEKTQISLGNSYKYLYYRIISLNDITGVSIGDLSLVYDYWESVYEGYKKSKAMDYKVEINKEAKETVVKIHNKDRLKINAILIKANGEFNRDYQLYQTSEEENNLEHVTTGSIYSFNQEEFQVHNTTISAEEAADGFLASEYLQIMIDDRDDQPINIEALEISYYIDKVVFKTNDMASLQLLFGNQEAKKPHYDIGIYSAEMEKAKQETAILSELEKRDIEEIPQEKSFDFTWILNICIGVISVLLVVLIFRKAPK